MVGLVLVAHSAELVYGLTAMVEQAAPGVPVEAAGGLSRDRLGTSAPAITAALESALARAGDGVLVLLDLGSAWMAVELALEMLEPPARTRVRVTEAPLVEGAVHAAVAARGGADLAAVEAAAVVGGGGSKRPAG